MRIFLASPIHPPAAESLGQRHQVRLIQRPSHPAGDPGLADCEALILRSGVELSEEVLRQAPELRLVVRAGSGLDNVDLAYLEGRGIRLVRVPGPGARAVAELTFGLMLAVTRRIAEADRQMRLGMWRKTQLAGPLLEGSTLGVVGVGRIGTIVGQLGVAWGMTAIGCGQGPRDVLAGQSATGIQQTSFDNCVAEADVLSLHVPLTPSTRHLVDAEVLSRLKPSAVVINTARGGVLDEYALYSALKYGRIAGAGLDVHERESDGTVPRLAELANVVLTPHIGAMASESQRRIGERVVELIEAYENSWLDAVARPDELIL